MSPASQTTRVPGLRQSARENRRRGDLAGAEHVFSQLLDALPHDPEALQFLASCHQQRGELAQALGLLERVSSQDPAAEQVELQRGSVRLAMGDFPAAAGSLQRGLQHIPDAFVARLQLGIALEQMGRTHEALLAYYRALRTAQDKGRWRDEASTAPALRDVVTYATRYVRNERRRLFSEVIAPLRQRYGASELARVEQTLAIYLGDREADYPDPRQRPTFLYFAGIPSQPFYPRHRLPWLDVVEEASVTIRGELESVLSEGLELDAFLGPHGAAESAGMLRASGGHHPAWDAFFFYRHGVRHDEHCARCPATAAVLDTVPLVRIRDHAPETLFSVLKPGTHILPHRGVTNTRLVTHLPLIVPPDCALRVGGEAHIWDQGQCVTFDDTFEHEAWNRSDETRVVLILDSWNPDLSEVEREAVTDLVAAIGDFRDASRADRY